MRQAYIFLEEDDIIQDGDEWLDMYFQWHVTSEAGIPFVNDYDNPTYYRRKVETKEVEK